MGADTIPRLARLTGMNTVAGAKTNVPNRPTGAARSMVSIGGAITFIVVPLIAGGLLLFVTLLAIGFGGDPDEAGRFLLVAGTAVVVVEIVLLLVWRRGLQGDRTALVALLIVGVALSLWALRTLLGFVSEEIDLLFLGVFALGAGGPLLLAVGAYMGLTERRRSG
jgi:hypothetical protein